MAQEPKMPTLEDLIPGGATYRSAENISGLQWWGDQCIKPGIEAVFMINPKNGKETPLTTRNIVNKATLLQCQFPMAEEKPYADHPAG